jgi:hypothetical protein
MTTTFPKATLTKVDFTSDPFVFRRPDDSLISKRVLVDCHKASQPITISLYDYRGYHCSIWIKDTHCLTGHGKGSTILKALVGALNEIGITFETPIPENLTTQEQIEGVMHAIADALQINQSRVITHAWT